MAEGSSWLLNLGVFDPLVNVLPQRHRGKPTTDGEPSGVDYHGWKNHLPFSEILVSCARFYLQIAVFSP
jgi:hypothetical protein